MAIGNPRQPLGSSRLSGKPQFSFFAFLLHRPHLFPLDPLNTCSWTSFNCHLIWVINTFLLLYACFSDGLKPSSAIRLDALTVARKLFDSGFPTLGSRPFTISTDQGTHFIGQMIWALMKNWQTSWNYHCPYITLNHRVRSRELMEILVSSKASINYMGLHKLRRML